MKLRLFDAMQRSRAWVAFILIGVFAALTACTVYEPAPAPQPSAFDRSWNAALAAIQDAGLQVISQDRAAGVIRGAGGEQEATINLRTQADGSVRVEISVRGPKDRSRD